VALSFGGIGFGFIGKDEGLSKTLESVNKGFTGVWGGFKKLADGSGKMAARIMGGLGKVGGAARGAFGGMSGMLDSMAQKALSPELDKPFDKMYAQFSKVFGEITVGMGLSEKESKRWYKAISGAAFGLYADMGETAKAWAEFRKQGVKLDQLLGTKGMTASIKGLIKVTQTMGIEGQELALMTSGLVKGFGFTEKRVKGLLDQVFFMGKQFGVGKETIAGLPAVMQTLNKELATFFKGRPEEVEKFSKGIVKLGIAFKEGLGTSAKHGMDLATDVFVTITKEWKNVGKQFIGKGGAIGELAKGLTEAGGDFNAVMKMFMKDPVKFMKAMSGMAKAAKKHGGETGATFLRLEDTIEKAFGADAVFMVKGGWDRSSKAISGLNELMKDTKNVAGSLMKAVSKAFKTGATSGDAFDRSLKSFQSRIMKLSDPLARQWLKDQKKGFKDTAKIVQKLSGKEGPIGKLTKRLLLVQRVGISGLFTGMKGQLSALGPVFSNVLTTMGPMLSSFAALGMSLGMIGKLLMPGGILILGLALFHKGVRDKLVEGAGKVFDYLKENIPKWIPKLKAGLEWLWATAIKAADWLGKVLPPMINKIIEFLAGIDWGRVATVVLKGLGFLANLLLNAVIKVSKALPGIMSRLFSKISEWVARVDWSALAKKVFGGLMVVLKGLGSVLIKAIGGLGKILMAVDWSAVGNALASFLWKALKWAVTSLIPKLAKALAKMALAALHAVGKLIIGIGSAVKSVTSGMSNYAEKMKQEYIKATTLVAKQFVMVSGVAATEFSSMERSGAKAFQHIGERSKDGSQLSQGHWLEFAQAMGGNWNYVSRSSKIGTGNLMSHAATGAVSSKSEWRSASDMMSEDLARFGETGVNSFNAVGTAALKNARMAVKATAQSLKAMGKSSATVVKMLSLVTQFNKAIAMTKGRVDASALIAGRKEAVGKLQRIRYEKGKAIENLEKLFKRIGSVKNLSSWVKSRLLPEAQKRMKKGLTAAYSFEQALIITRQKVMRAMTARATEELSVLRGFGRGIYKEDPAKAKQFEQIARGMVEKGVFRGMESFSRATFRGRIERYRGRRARGGVGGAMGAGKLRLKKIKAPPGVPKKLGVLGAPGAEAMAKVLPEGKTDTKKRTQLDKQLAEGSKKAVSNMSTQLENLADAIRNIRVEVYPRGDIGKFITFATAIMRRKGAGAVAASLPGRLGNK
jgi:hypothetical protein